MWGDFGKGVPTAVTQSTEHPAAAGNHPRLGDDRHACQCRSELLDLLLRYNHEQTTLQQTPLAIMAAVARAHAEEPTTERQGR